MCKTRVKVQDTDKCYECPHCKYNQVLDGEEEPIAYTEPIFTGDFEEFGDEPGLYWIELHQCKSCRKLYIIENGA